jgi:hypothetical protein
MLKTGSKSFAVLIKKAMAKMPKTLNTKKSIDEYYKTAMKEIATKMKAEEKAVKAVTVKKAKTVMKPKKLVGGMTGEELKNELEIIDKIMELFIDYNKEVSEYRNSVGDAKFEKGRGYFLSDKYTDDINNLVAFLKSIQGIKEKIDTDDILKDSERKEKIIISKESPIYRNRIYDALTVYIKDTYIIIATRHPNSFNKYKTGYYKQLYSELYNIP